MITKYYSLDHGFFELFMAGDDQFEIRRTGTCAAEDDVYGVFRLQEYLFSTGYESFTRFTTLCDRVVAKVGVDVGSN